MKGHDVPSKGKTIGVVLAGGASSRMGRNKALLPYKGRYLVDHIIQQHRQAGADSVYISGALANYPHIADQWPGQGPVAGICSVILALEKQSPFRLLISSVDCPHLKASSLEKLARSNHKTCYFAGSTLPCTIEVNTAVSTLIKRDIVPLFASRSLSVRSFLAYLEASPLPVGPEDRASLINTNTPEEWEAAQNEYTL